MNRTKSVLAVLFVCAMTAFIPQTLRGQATPSTNLAVTEAALPDAPTPAMAFSSSTAGSEGAISLLPAAQPSKKPGWLKRNTLPLGFIATAGGDYALTAVNMLHSLWLCGDSPNIPPGNAMYVNVGFSEYGELNVPGDVHAVCGPNANYAYNVDRIGNGNAFTEAGWAAAWGICNNRNLTCVIGSNIAYDAIHLLLVKHYEKKGGWKKKIANLTLLYHAEQHVEGGFTNWRFDHDNRDPNAWGRNITGFEGSYPNPRWWGK